MNIVKQKWIFLNTTARYVPSQVAKLYEFGVKTLTNRVVVSFRSNSRLLSLNWNTAKSKAYRLSANLRMPEIFISLLKKFSLVGENDVVAVDFSDFGNGFQVLMFAKQTKRGRALPLYFEILKYPIQRGSQNLFIISAIQNFAGIVGCKPKLVFDRGFACPVIIHFMAQNKYKFIVRIKKGKSTSDLHSKKKISAAKRRKNDKIVCIYGLKLRLVISDTPEDMKEAWYLITNDIDGKRDAIIDEYYHRFEIEEFFRDAKRLLGLEQLRIEKASSLSVALWFTILGIWFFHRLEAKMKGNDEKARIATELSVTRYFFEQMQREYVIATESKYLEDYGLKYERKS